jgi:hypothetical protein
MVSAQTLIVVLILFAAAGYFGAMIYRKVRAFAPQSGCGDDCGCNGQAKKLNS